MTVYKIVLDVLNERTQSDPQKTIGQAILDGTISKEDLSRINSTTAFPPNNFNRLNLPEGEYSSQEVMMAFVRTIGPFLSDQALYHLTHRLAEIETGMDQKATHGNTQAYRTSTLAKYFMIYEVERQTEQTPAGELPKPTLAHMQAYLLPLCEAEWPTHLDSNVNTFARFNFDSRFLSPEMNAKFKRDDYYHPIAAFDAKQFDPKQLSATPPRPVTQFASYIKELHAAYQALPTQAKAAPAAAKSSEASAVKKKGEHTQHRGQISRPAAPPIKATTMFAKAPVIEASLQVELRRMDARIARLQDKYEGNLQAIAATSTNIAAATRALEAEVKEAIARFKVIQTTLEAEAQGQKAELDKLIAARDGLVAKLQDEGVQEKMTRKPK